MKHIYTLTLFIFITSTLAAQSPASFDSSFDGDGRSLYPLTTINTLPNYKGYHLLQPDGKIVFCTNRNLGNNKYEAVVARLNPNGSPDSAFANFGTFSYPVAPDDNLAVGLVRQSDGKIVTAGICKTANSLDINNIFLIRLQSNGTLDTTFGIGGISILTLSEYGTERLTNIKQMSSGSFVVSGYITIDGFDSAYILKVKPNGKPDSSFAVNGVFRYPYNNGESTRFYDLEVLPDQSIISGGRTAGIQIDGIIVKVDSNGTLFNGFGIGGVFKKQLTYYDDDGIHDLKVLPNGEILAAGHAYENINTLYKAGFVLKLTPSGNLYSGFANNGFLFYNTPGTDNRFYGMAVEPGGKIVLTGYYYNNSTSNYDAMVVRLLSNGTPDTSFNHSKSYLYINWYKYAYGSSVLIQPDGKILLYGLATNNATSQIFLPAFTRLRGGESGSVMPLELLHFTATKKNNNTLLRWITANQLNLACFIVEKGENNFTFKAVAKVPAHNSGQKNEYIFQEENKFQGQCFYRLKMTDKDGSYRYSPTLSIINQDNTMDIYPTVTTSGITIQSTSSKGFSLYNSSGQFLRILSSGYNDISNEKSGVYFIKTKNSTVKIYKQ